MCLFHFNMDISFMMGENKHVRCEELIVKSNFRIFQGGTTSSKVEIYWRRLDFHKIMSAKS